MEQVHEVYVPQVQVMDTIERASIDTMVATAKAYPRNVMAAINNVKATVTSSVELATKCSYSLPRQGKTITGPSVHLAKILAYEWGNLRTEAKVIAITDKQIISRGICYDIEKNIASAFEVRRSIVSKNGQRYNDDMITVTGNAANAIAYRNAVFAVIPQHISEEVYNAARRKQMGDLNNEDVLIQQRTNAINYFKNEYGIKPEELLKLLGKKTELQIRQDEIITLRGILQSLKDGDTTVDDLMEPIRNTKESKAMRLAEELKNNK